MPLYEYKCRDCQSHFEFMQKVSDPPKKKCPKCGGPLEKILTAPALQFKGQGWYITDYSRKSGVGEAKATGSSEAKPESKSESKKDSSPQKKDTSSKKD
jgi:putative FmdB family regulatory protein